MVDIQNERVVVGMLDLVGNKISQGGLSGVEMVLFSLYLVNFSNRSMLPIKKQAL